MSKAILVVGATGKQGGAVIRALQDSDFDIIGLTRNTSSPAANKLIERYPGLKLVQGDLNNSAAVIKQAKYVSKSPIWGIYSMQVGADGPDKEAEVKQGKNMIDAAISNDVKFFVQGSIDRGGVKSSKNPTPIPFWATKHHIEKHLESRAPGTQMQYTVLRPVAFMDELTNDFMGKAMATMWRVAIPKDKPLQLCATKDIGWFAAQAFRNPDAFAGRYISIAGASLTHKQANEVFKEKFGKDLPGIPGVLAKVILKLMKDIGLMFKWLGEEGNAADIEELKRMNPELTSFGTWLVTESQFKNS